MKGVSTLLAMRSRGVRPAAVHVHVGADPLRMASDWPQRDLSAAWVEFGEDESLASADWRWAVGMPVQVAGGPQARVWKVAHAIQQAGATVVVAYSDGVLWMFAGGQWRKSC